MRFSQKFALRAGAVGVVAAAIVVPATGAFAGTTTGPTLSATPNSGLHDGDSVSVTGDGFTPSTAYSLVQCSGTSGPADCDIANATGGATDGTGHFTNTYTVHTGQIGNGTCKAGSTNCFLAASTDNGGPDTAIAPLSFAALPSVTVTPAKGVHNHQKVKVDGQNFPTDSPLFIIECSGTSGAANCDTDTLDTSHSTDGSGSFTARIRVHTGVVGDGKCKPGGKCYVAASTSTTPDPTTSAAGKFKFAGNGIATTTTAKFVSKTSKIVGKVKAHKKGVAGLKEILDRRKGGHWKKVDSFKSHKGGKFHSSKLTKNGKYRVKTPKQTKGSKTYGSSHSKTIHV